MTEADAGDQTHVPCAAHTLAAAHPGHSNVLGSRMAGRVLCCLSSVWERTRRTRFYNHAYREIRSPLSRDVSEA